MPEAKTIVIGGKAYEYAAMTVGVLRNLPEQPPKRHVRGLCVASLAAAGNVDAAATVARMPYFGPQSYSCFIDAVLDLHGLKTIGKSELQGNATGTTESAVDWPMLFHRLASAYHWSEDQIDALPVPRLWRYLELIAEEPSHGQMLSIIAQCLGWKKPTSKPKPTGQKTNAPLPYTGPKTNGNPSQFNPAALGMGGMLPLDRMPAHIRASALQTIEKLRAEQAPEL